MRVVSGIQPTGVPHLGNYFGAFVNWIRLQNEGHDCFYCIANLHAITLPKDPRVLEKNSLEGAATLFAVGLDPEKSTIFIQSDVPEHAQLAWILNCLAPIGHMERMIQFKEKSEKNPEGLNLGLFSYPVLQAADILLYKAELVPVGVDQAQHLELTRGLAKKFNHTYGNLFPEPETLHTTTTKIVGLDGSAKMSKSANNYIGLTEPADVILKKLRGAATDPARITKKDPGNPFICNIFKLHEIISPRETIDSVIDGCENAKIGCIDCKQLLYKNMELFLKPIRERFNEWMAQPKKLAEALEYGAQKARKVAQKTLDEVYQAVGFNYPKR